MQQLGYLLFVDELINANRNPDFQSGPTRPAGVSGVFPNRQLGGATQILAPYYLVAYPVGDVS